jgi:hypothetical protein
MKAQSQEHVERCESATTPASSCKCRCHGRCHGRRLVADGAGREAFEALAADDPHRLQTALERLDARRAGEREAREQKRLEKLNRGRRAFIEDVRGRNPRRAAELEAKWFEAA